MPDTPYTSRAACTGCEACVAVCPVGCIAMAPDGEGFCYPVINQAACIGCNACTALCPVGKAAPRPPIAAHALRVKDEALRKSSSSGGAFSLLASSVLLRGGRVAGARLDERLQATHTVVETQPTLAPLRGSKYVQSGGLKAVYADLLQARERPFLFSGTPCQVAGLRALMEKAPPGDALCVDFVCHGAPSPMVWRAYLAHLAKEAGSAPTGASFRDKGRGWRDFALRVTFENGESRALGQREDPYLRLFLQNMVLRPSCHACPFRGDRRQGDLTLADLWGAEKVAAPLDDDRGLSLVLVGTEKGGQALYGAAAGQADCIPVDPAPTYPDNPCLRSPVPPHDKREAVLKYIRLHGFSGVEKKFLAPPGRAVALARRLRRAIARRIKR